MIVLSYPDKLEAVNTAKWDGWTRMYDGAGAAFYTSYMRDSYLELRPKAATTQSSGGMSGGALTAIVVVVAGAVVVGVVLLLRRRRAAPEEE
jgi:hypothetical protein